MGTNTTEAKRAILEEARAQFAAKGYDGTSVDAIVKAAGVSKGAFYWHFDSKFSLFRTLLQEELQRLRVFFDVTEEDLQDPLPALVRKGEAYLDRLTEDRQAHLLWLELCVGSHRGREEMIVLGRELSTLVRQEILRILRATFPSLEDRPGAPRTEDLVLWSEILLDGLAANLGLRLDLEAGKALWRETLRRWIEGGTSYVA